MSAPSPSALPACLAAELARSYEELHRYATRKYAAAADDLLQEAWVRLASRTSTGGADDERAVQDPLPYLRRVVDNLAVDRRRREASQARFLGTAECPDQIASPGPAPEQVVLGWQEYAILQQAIGDLPEQARRVFVLFRGRGLSMAQIATHLGISPRTVEKHIAAAVAHCRRRLRASGRET